MRSAAEERLMGEVVLLFEISKELCIGSSRIRPVNDSINVARSQNDYAVPLRVLCTLRIHLGSQRRNHDRNGLDLPCQIAQPGSQLRNSIGKFLEVIVD